ncbi:organic radical activating enzyme [Desulfocapsa sulfexigens DSM 10523]|uniref:7-carboxy-7-deazaguanine synthase n=1 Tax=Desulfocapsa sulfexigens (strain DSM 10523 / SB164P1) TaxID=1167006 RepID=M1PDU7_DESSD|nr:radical SAM protein [Desulfocapsa sulfexigens]AGF79762.1 organic radical activating enzyme [Desulfocapsa sulfexigens DSM 10523]
MPANIKISEIFYSIQGESSYAGLPCIFIRLSGCNLRCNYCDAAYTWEEGDPWSIDSILAKVNSYPCDLVEVTGGEPLLQKNCPELLAGLSTQGKKTLLETNGSIAINAIPDETIAILDVKCPDSGSKDSFHPDNLLLIRNRLAATPGSAELKFVLSTQDDYIWAKNFISQHQLVGLLPILFSPVQPGVTAQDLADWILKDGLDVRLQIQLHTILWPTISRGV